VPIPDDSSMLSGRYRLDARIGAGGAGAVWRAYDTVLTRPVAVKLLHGELEADEDTRRRFRREATAAASIHHPNAAVVYDIGEDDGRVYLVMELVDGPSLADLVDGSPIDADVVAAIGHQVAGALGAAHRQGLAHRDIKPANVLLTPEGTAKVVDFGIAKALGEATQQLTAAGTVVGTAAYLAPEQLEVDGDVDGRADVYALGLVMHQLLTGRAPFSGGTTAETAAQRLIADAPRPRRFRSDVPDALDDLVAKATRLDPSRRFADGQALATALAPHVLPQADRLLAEFAHRQPAAVDHTRELTAVEPGAVETQVVPRTTQPAHAATDTDTPAEHTARIATAAASTATPRPGAREPIPEPPLEPPADADRPPRRTAVWTGVAVVLVAALAAGLMSDDAARRGAGEPGSDAARPDAAAGPYPIVDGSDVDPFGDDGREHPEDVPSAFDGNPATAWTTSRYDTPDLGGLKPGVGLMLDLGESVPVSQVQLLLATAGIDLQIHVSDQPFSGPDIGDPVAAVQDAPAEPTIEVSGASGRYWLIWITRVPGGRAQIAEVAFGRA
jgi:hypothetical protein